MRTKRTEHKMADSTNLQKSYSMLNEKLIKLFDESGVRRSFTVPYVEGQATDEHVNSVGRVALDAGGLSNNLVLTAHHSNGKGFGSGDGHTTGHPAESLRNTIIPKDDEHAKAAIDAAQKHLNNMEKLLGKDDPTIQTAQGQLSMVKKTDGVGMNLLDFGVMMTQIMFKPMQAIARAHSGTKEGGHAPHLRAPGSAAAPEGQEQPGQPAEQENAQEQPQGAPAGGEQPEAQAAPAAAPAGAPATAQA
jgi:hypothetical protein